MTSLAKAALYLLSASANTPAAAAAMDCLPTTMAPITVRIGSEPPTPALLQGGLEIPLQLVDAATGRLLWSAGDAAHFIQRIPHMDAGFAGGIAVVDLDADGLHDRLYAADLSARIWRFDLRHGRSASDWATGGLFADFSNDEGRSFVATPDLSLSSPPGVTPWLNIAIGTASPGNPSANNRFYALRDPFVHAAPDAWDSADWHPLQEADLARVAPALPSATGPGFPPAPVTPYPGGYGWYVELGGGHVLTPTLTVHDRALLVIARALPQAGSCEILVRIAVFELPAQRVVANHGQDTWSHDLPEPVPAGSILEVLAVSNGVAPCMLHDMRVPACDVDTRPRRTWWRREDAP